MRKPNGKPPESIDGESHTVVNSEPLICPVAEPVCQYLDEVSDLRSRLSEMSHQLNTDPLTDVFNYRYFVKALGAEMERTVRTGQPTALLMIDLDHFKNVNDTWGHEVGNKTLVQTATLMKNSVRKLDIPCRYGGEEFALVLPSTDLLTAVKVAERIREQIASTPIVLEGKELIVTASFGLDVLNPGQNETVEGFVQRADHHLYRAKKEGRNRVCHAVIETVDDASVTFEEKDLLFSLISGDSEAE